MLGIHTIFFYLKRHFSFGVLLLSLLACNFYNVANGQNLISKDTSNLVAVQILQSGYGESVTTDSGSMTKLVNDVILKQGTNDMYCDSAYINLATNNVQAWGNVRIIQAGGSQVESDYLRYSGNSKQAYLRGNVSLTDGKSYLWTEELFYNTDTKIGRYSQGGTLENLGTTVSSNTGVYNLKTKQSRFTDNVDITDPRYTVTSGDLSYNTETEFVNFHQPSVVINNDGSVLRTSQGTYDAKKGLANFTGRTAMQDKNQYIEGDRLIYSRDSRKGEAHGEVITIDTGMHITLWCKDAWYNGAKSELLAVGKPLLRKENPKDSFYLAADTFFTAPDIRFRKLGDTVSKKTIATTQGKTSPLTLTQADTSATTDDSAATYIIKRQQRAKLQMKPTAVKDISRTHVASSGDSSLPKYFIGYHHVKIFSDSLQGLCDSLSYSQGDSIMKMMIDPIVWSRNSQIMGDTIILYMDSGKIRKLFVPNNATVISLNEPHSAKLYNQVQGKTLTAYFENGELDKVVIWPAAEAIFYSKDDDGAYLGVTETTAERITMIMGESGMKRIKMEQDVNQTMTPLQDPATFTLRLSRFEWREEERPKTLDDLLD